MIIAIAREFKMLPDKVEAELSDYWFQRIVVVMDAETLDRQRRDEEMERDRNRR